MYILCNAKLILSQLNFTRGEKEALQGRNVYEANLNGGGRRVVQSTLLFLQTALLISAGGHTHPG